MVTLVSICELTELELQWLEKYIPCFDLDQEDQATGVNTPEGLYFHAESLNHAWCTEFLWPGVSRTLHIHGVKEGQMVVMMVKHITVLHSYTSYLRWFSCSWSRLHSWNRWGASLRIDRSLAGGLQHTNIYNYLCLLSSSFILDFQTTGNNWSTFNFVNSNYSSFILPDHPFNFLT